MADVKSLMSELDRAFRVLGRDCGFAQNAIDIIAWRIEGLITEEESRELREYNILQVNKL